MGKNDIKRAEGISAAELTAYGDQLQKFLNEIRDAQVTARTQPKETLYTYNVASLTQGLKRLRAFTIALADSNFRAKTNRPIEPGDLKNERRKEDQATAPPKKASRKK